VECWLFNVSEGQYQLRSINPVVQNGVVKDVFKGVGHQLIAQDILMFSVSHDSASTRSYCYIFYSNTDSQMLKDAQDIPELG